MHASSSSAVDPSAAAVPAPVLSPLEAAACALDIKQVNKLLKLAPAEERGRALIAMMRSADLENNDDNLNCIILTELLLQPDNQDQDVSDKDLLEAIGVAYSKCQCGYPNTEIDAYLMSKYDADRIGAIISKLENMNESELDLDTIRLIPEMCLVYLTVSVSKELSEERKETVHDQILEKCSSWIGKYAALYKKVKQNQAIPLESNFAKTMLQFLMSQGKLDEFQSFFNTFGSNLSSEDRRDLIIIPKLKINAPEYSDILRFYSGRPAWHLYQLEYLKILKNSPEFGQPVTERESECICKCANIALDCLQSHNSGIRNHKTFHSEAIIKLKGLIKVFGGVVEERAAVTDPHVPKKGPIWKPLLAVVGVLMLTAAAVTLAVVTYQYVGLWTAQTSAAFLASISVGAWSAFASALLATIILLKFPLNSEILRLTAALVVAPLLAYQFVGAWIPATAAFFLVTLNLGAWIAAVATAASVGAVFGAVWRIGSTLLERKTEAPSQSRQQRHPHGGGGGGGMGMTRRMMTQHQDVSEDESEQQLLGAESRGVVGFAAAAAAPGGAAGAHSSSFVGGRVRARARCESDLDESDSDKNDADKNDAGSRVSRTP